MLPIKNWDIVHLRTDSMPDVIASRPHASGDSNALNVPEPVTYFMRVRAKTLDFR